MIFQTNNIPKALMIISIIIAIAFSVILYMSIGHTTYLETSNISFDNNSKDFKYHIDHIKVHTDKKYLFISGWIFKKGEVIKEVSSYFVLYDEQEKKYLLLPSTMVTRNDLKKIFNQKYSGIKSIVKFKKLNSKHTYKIYVLYKNNKNNILVFMNKRINGLGEVIK